MVVGLARRVRQASGSHYIMKAGILVAMVASVIITGTTMGLEANMVAFIFWLMLGIGSLYATQPQPA